VNGVLTPVRTGLVLCLLGVAAAYPLLAGRMNAQEAERAKGAGAADARGWQAVAPGRVEPVSGEIRIASAVPGRIVAVLVKAGDNVFAGEALIRLDDDEARAHVAKAEVQVALRKRVRGEQIPGGRAGDRRRAEDAVVDAERALDAARAALDRAAAARRAGKGSQAELDKTRAALARATAELGKWNEELRKIEADPNTPLPTANEGQLNIARIELRAAQASLDRLTIRSPIDGTVLQVNARPGELASAATQPLLLLGDLSRLRVRAEVDERDLAEIKPGHLVVVRTAALRGSEFSGKVSFIAPIVEAGRINARGQRSLTDVNVAEVLVDVAEPGPLTVGMKVDVYFRYPAPRTK
jgi:HlyD family secretion protein